MANEIFKVCEAQVEKRLFLKSEKGFGVSVPVVLFAMLEDVIEVQQSQNQTKRVLPAFPVACAEGPVLALLGKF